MKPKIKIALIASEASPFAKVGGLADVVSALPKELLVLGADARVIVPRYQSVRLRELKTTKAAELTVPFLGKTEKITVYQTCVPGSKVIAYLIDHPTLLSGGGIYSNPNAKNDPDFPNRRFIFFCKATLRVLEHLRFAPDILHLHDWPTAVLAAVIKFCPPKFLTAAKTLLTIHNLNNSNYASTAFLAELGLHPDTLPAVAKSKTNAKYYDLMALGLASANFINTVSPTYAREILKPPLGCGMDSLLRSRKKNLVGILNGIDTDYFNPQTDRYLSAKFGADTLDRKRQNKITLQKELRIQQNPAALLCGVVTRLSKQKGLELIVTSMENGLLDFAQVVVLGEGEERYQTMLRKQAQKHPRQLAFVQGYDAHLARRIYAGADLFLMPSRFEPCGLTQLIAMRYGALPLVHNTGGLHDTVMDWKKTGGCGFVFDKFESAALDQKLQEAAKLFGFPKLWRKLQLRAAKKNFSWHRSAKEYLNLYIKILKI